jgi:hypothetical protein
MAQTKYALTVGAFVFLAVFSGVLTAYLTIHGVPTEWAFGSLPPLSVIQSHFDVSVSPSTPTTLGQEILVRVVDANTTTPVENATVSVSKDNYHIADFSTDAIGEVRFQYPGETTIIIISKMLYSKYMVVIPKVPDIWIQQLAIGRIFSFISAVISGVIAAIITKKVDLPSAAKPRKKSRRRKRMKAKPTT